MIRNTPYSNYAKQRHRSNTTNTELMTKATLLKHDSLFGKKSNFNNNLRLELYQSNCIEQDQECKEKVIEN